MDKRIKEEEKVQQHTLQTVRDHWKSEKPARQSVTLILKSNSTPTQLYCARTPSHNILPFVSGLVRGACWPTSPPQQPLPKPPTPLHCITKVPPPLTICHPYTSPYPSRVPAWPCPAPPLRPPVRRPHSPAVTLALCLFGSVISQLWVTFGHLLATQWQSSLCFSPPPDIPVPLAFFLWPSHPIGQGPLPDTLKVLLHPQKKQLPKPRPAFLNSLCFRSCSLALAAPPHLSSSADEVHACLNIIFISMSQKQIDPLKCLLLSVDFWLQKPQARESGALQDGTGA